MITQLIESTKKDPFTTCLIDLQQSADEARKEWIEGKNLVFENWIVTVIDNMQKKIKQKSLKVEVLGFIMQGLSESSFCQPQELQDKQNEKEQDANSEIIQKIYILIQKYFEKQFEMEENIIKNESLAIENEKEFDKVAQHIQKYQNFLRNKEFYEQSDFKSYLEKFSEKREQPRKSIQKILEDKQNQFQEIQKLIIQNLTASLKCFSRDQNYLQVPKIYQKTRDLKVFTSVDDFETKDFRWESNYKEIQFLKVYGTKRSSEITNFSIENDKTTLATSDLPYVCQVKVVKELHTIKVRKDAQYVTEIEFIGENASSKTDEFNQSDHYKWCDFKLQANETVIGIYGSSFKQDNYYKRFKTLGFVLGKLK